MNNPNYGTLTPHAVGVVLKEMVRRAIETIQAQQFSFEVEEKQGPSGELDFVTSADLAAQEIYLRMIKECLPGCGVIAEEDGLRVPCERDDKLWLTVDPLDGTRAFISGVPAWGILLGLTIDDVPVAGAMHQPYLGETFFGGDGAARLRRNGEGRIASGRSARAGPIR